MMVVDGFYAVATSRFGLTMVSVDVPLRGVLTAGTAHPAPNVAHLARVVLANALGLPSGMVAVEVTR